MDTPYIVKPDRPLFNGVLFGDPGSGKTSLAATAQDHPAMADALILNFEGGTLSVAHRGDIRAIDIDSTNELEEVMVALRRRSKEFKGIRTVIIDSATEIQTQNLEEIVEREMNKPKGRGKRRENPNEIYRGDYGESTTQLKRIFRNFRDMKRHVIFTALAKYVYPKVPDGTDMTNIDPIAVIPSLTSKLASSLMGYVDFVWYCYYDKDEDTYKVMVKPHEAYFAKTRGPKFARALGDELKVDISKPKRTGMPFIYETWLRSSKPTTKGEATSATENEGK